ncbi:MAG: DUF1295 domain-containing protein [Brevundimonas sp.]|uniref:DUF1295 domain-containing protein n=1 Tax=Brevundimonas sp. TaxID=1871086 RepID=UPI0025C0C208|nr:DUF1295 domain-containing protein [Brevundimonas sp.]MBX3477725.1 DUF1295 domain-containing protein [Brevundimonas sp.]
MWVAIIVAGALAVLWLAAIPADFRARRWHHVHIALLVAVVALYAALKQGAIDLPALTGAVQLFVECGGVLLVLALLAWGVGTICRNHSYMDIAYPLMSLGVAAYGLFRSGSGFSLHALLLFALVAVWALRLVSHAVRTNLKVEQEPYASLRRRYGDRWFVWSFFAVYALQGAIVWFWTAALVFAMAAPGGALTWLSAVGAVVWLVGFAFQAVGDWQLKQFKKDPANRGKLMQAGLWSRTRHPNYFGESVMWAAHYAFALAHPWGWVTLFSPAYVYWFMGYGSAAPGNERHMRKTRPDYDDYARRVPRMFPRLFAPPGASR